MSENKEEGDRKRGGRKRKGENERGREGKMKAVILANNGLLSQCKSPGSTQCSRISQLLVVLPSVGRQETRWTYHQPHVLEPS